MHAIMFGLSRNVPIFVLKVYILGNPSVLGKPEWWATLVVGTSTALKNLVSIPTPGF